MPKKTEKEKQLENSKIFLDRKTINEPTRKFRVGEKVEFGSWDEAVIKEKFADGKYYHVFAFSKKKKDGDIVDTASNQYVAWHNIQKLNRKTAGEPVHENEGVHSLSFGNTTIESLISAYYGSGIDMDPEYQRGLVWKRKDKIALVDSIMQNIDIGKFVLVEREFDGGPSYEIMDGKQRLQALVDFYEDRWSWRGMKFSQLHWRDKVHIESYSISYARIQPIPMELKLKYFIKLNTMGHVQKKSHLDKVRQMAEALNG